MSIDWLSKNPQYSPQSLLSPEDNLPFLPLDVHERVKYISKPRISLKLAANSTNELISFNDGRLFLTNSRIIFINDNHNFVLLLNKNLLEFGIDNSSWFGSNKYRFVFKPSFENAGLNHMYIWSLSVAFNEGGIFEFHECFKKVYDEYQNGEQLPAYSD